MADVVLGRTGSAVLVDLDVCAKTGRATGERVTLRGTTTPGWVLVLLLFTVIGFVLAYAMASRRYDVTLPFAREAYVRWTCFRLLAVVVGLGGAASLAVAVSTFGAASSAWGIVGIALIVAALVGGTVNTTVNGLRLRMTRNDDLVLSGAHPAFAQAMAAADVEDALR